MTEPVTSMAEGAGASTTPPSDAPDWSQIEHDVLCPLCEYNLRGLREPRCPECGYRFEWPEVIDPTRRLHPYLYEHHSERGFGSFWSTALHGLLPKQFWQTVNPIQPSRPERLRGYWLRCALLLVCGIVATCLVIVLFVYQHAVQTHGIQIQVLKTHLRQQLANPAIAAQDKARIQRSISSILTSRSANSPQLRSFVPRHMIRSLSEFVPFCTVLLLWPWTSLLSLMIFRWSMRCARIKAIHVQRCCLYSFDGLWWAGLLVLLVAIVEGAAAGGLLIIGVGGGMFLVLNFDAPGILWVPVLFGVWKLRQAYKYYLRFDRPGWTVLASQVIVVLALLCAWQMLNPDGPARWLSGLF